VNNYKESTMPLLMVSSAESRAQYDKVAGLVGDLAADRPEGLLAHVAAERPDGTVRIVDVWRSQEDVDAFGRDRIRPAFVDAGLPGLAERPQPEVHEVFEVVL
jgi:hypothetical protein